MNNQSMKPLRKLNGRGFSFAEILFSLALVGIIFVCLIQILIMGHVVIRQGSEIITATNLAQKVLDRTTLMGYVAVPVKDFPETTVFVGQDENSTAKVGDFPPSPYPFFEDTDTGIKYYVTAVTLRPFAGNERLTRVDVTVSWEGRAAHSYTGGKSSEGIKRHVTLSSMYSANY